MSARRHDRPTAAPAVTTAAAAAAAARIAR